MHHIRFNACAGALALALSAAFPLSAVADEAAPAAAAAEPTPDWTFPMSVSLVSDYIFRGQSQTWGKPAIQYGVEADHKSGFYAGFFISNVSDDWLPGAKVETDLYGGYRGKVNDDVSYDVGGIYYMYPGANWNDSIFDGYNKSNKLDTFEAYAAMTYKWLTFKTGVALTEYFGWSTNNSPVNGGFAGDAKAGVTGDTSGSYYYEIDGAYEVMPTWTVSGQLGRQEINNARGLDITYYKVGVSKALPHDFALGAFYSGSNQPDAYDHFVSVDNGHSASNVARDKFFVTLTKTF